ncbi:MAG TPA: DoxX family protein [Myxococcales bacterium]|nr:DoxX family protein [Myxococcales bacterium]
MAFALVENDARLRKEAAFVAPRAALGASMVFHGLGKLRGDAPQQAGQMFEQIGIRPGKHFAVATGIAETFAGVSAILGLWTRPAALAVLVTQAVAIAKVHSPKGYDITKGGFEYNLALMAIAVAMLITGPGLFSAHEGLERLAEGRGLRRYVRRAQPNLLLRIIKLLK